MLLWIVVATALSSLAYAVAWWRLPAEHRAFSFREHLFFFVLAGVFLLSGTAFAVQSVGQAREDAEKRASVQIEAQEALKALSSVETLDTYIHSGINCMDYTTKVRDAEASTDAFVRDHPNSQFGPVLKKALLPFVVAKKAWQREVDRASYDAPSYNVDWSDLASGLDACGVPRKENGLLPDTREKLWEMASGGLPTARKMLTDATGASR